MASNAKVSPERLLLAQAFDLCHDAEDKIRQADALQTKIAKSSQSNKDFTPVRRMYSVAYDVMLRGLTFFNRVRKYPGVDTTTKEFCGSKMTAFMDTCEKIREREANLLMLCNQEVEYGKEGWVKGADVFVHSPEQVLKAGEVIEWSQVLDEGAYNITVRNFTSSGLSPPTPTVMVTVMTHAGHIRQRWKKEFPARTAWTRNIGLGIKECGAEGARVSMKIVSDGWVRPLNIGVEVVKLRCCIGNDEREEGNNKTSWVRDLPEHPTHTPTPSNDITPVAVVDAAPPPLLPMPPEAIGVPMLQNNIPNNNLMPLPEPIGVCLPPNYNVPQPITMDNPQILKETLERCREKVSAWSTTSTARDILTMNSSDRKLFAAFLDLPRVVNAVVTDKEKHNEQQSEQQDKKHSESVEHHSSDDNDNNDDFGAALDEALGE
eukprot:PhM_4_TR3468/c0_g1_i1/m.60403